MFVNIFIKSKNERSIKLFLKFLNLYISIKKLNVIIFTSKFQKKIKKKIITVLKSPHVNKKAQEQFEVCIYKIQLNLFTYKSFLLLVFIKYLNSSVLFSDIHLKVKIKINNSNYQNILIDKLNPNKFYLLDYTQLFQKFRVQKSNYQSSKDLFLNIQFYLNLFDTYGEFNLKKHIKFL